MRKQIIIRERGKKKMSVNSFEELNKHKGHKIEIVTYGNPPVNVAIECLDCFEVLLFFDREG